MTNQLRIPQRSSLRSPFEHRRGGWSPLALFSSGEQGFIYDLSDMSTLFQDSAGTTPVTGPNQPVGLMLDKSGRGNHAVQPTAGKRPMLGREPFGGRRNLLTYTEDFSNAAWIKAGTFASGTFVREDSSSGYHGLYGPSTSVTSGLPYMYTFDIVDAGIGFVSVESTLGGNRSLLVNLTTGTAVASNIDGAWSVTAITGGWRVYCPFVASATNNSSPRIFFRQTSSAGTYVGDGTSGAYISFPQFEQSSTATPYQKVVSIFDVTEQGKADCWYIKGDGIDDFMYTGNIDFTGTDKMTVWAGIRKLDDAVRMVYELSATVTGNAGSMYLTAGIDNLASSGYNAISRFDADIGPDLMANIVPFPGVDTAALTITHDIPGDLSTIQRNGVAGTPGTGDKGTGNFGNYPLYLLSRGGSSFFLNGHLYSLMIRGAATDATGITNGEKWTAQRIGVTLP